MTSSKYISRGVVPDPLSAELPGAFLGFIDSSGGEEARKLALRTTHIIRLLLGTEYSTPLEQLEQTGTRRYRILIFSSLGVSCPAFLKKVLELGTSD